MIEVFFLKRELSILQETCSTCQLVHTQFSSRRVCSKQNSLESSLAKRKGRFCLRIETLFMTFTMLFVSHCESQDFVRPWGWVGVVWRGVQTLRSSGIPRIPFLSKVPPDLLCLQTRNLGSVQAGQKQVRAQLSCF